MARRHTIARRASLLTSVVIACVVLWQGAGAAMLPAAAAACDLRFISPKLVPITGQLGGVVIDDACEHLYVTNTDANRVEDFSLPTLTLNPPIAVGLAPLGLDLRPGTNLLYVANSEGSSISVIDLEQRVEIRRIPIQPSWITRSPYSIAIAGNGLALFTTRHHGSSGGDIMQLNLETEQATLRPDFSDYGSAAVTNSTRVKASADRSTIRAVVHGSSGGLVVKYVAATDQFTRRYLSTGLSNVSSDATGAVSVAAGFFGSFVLDPEMNLAGTVGPGQRDWGGIAVSPDGRTGYRSLGPKIDVMDLVTFLTSGHLALGDTLNGAYYDNVGIMDISRDGRLLAVITDHGLSLVRTEPQEFTDEPLAAGATPLKSIHITELRVRIDAQRVRVGLSPFAWTDPAVSGAIVRAAHVSELRTALQQTYTRAGRTAPVFSEPIVAGSTSIKAAHINELRGLLAALEIDRPQSQ